MKIQVRRRLPGYSGWEGCLNCGATPTRFYGEDVPTEHFTGFTGWRGPYCSVPCYRLEHDDPNVLEDLARATATDTRPVRPATGHTS